MNRPGFDREMLAPPSLNRRAFLDRSSLAAAVSLGGLGWLAGRSVSGAAQKEVLPKHVTPEPSKPWSKASISWPSKQSDDGSWVMGGGEAYPVAMTALAGTAMLAHGNSPTRGKYAKNVQGLDRIPGALRHPDRACSPAPHRMAASPCTGTASPSCSWPASTA